MAAWRVPVCLVRPSWTGHCACSGCPAGHHPAPQAQQPGPGSQPSCWTELMCPSKTLPASASCSCCHLSQALHVTCDQQQGDANCGPGVCRCLYIYVVHTYVCVGATIHPPEALSQAAIEHVGANVCSSFKELHAKFTAVSIYCSISQGAPASLSKRNTG